MKEKAKLASTLHTQGTNPIHRRMNQPSQRWIDETKNKKEEHGDRRPGLIGWRHVREVPLELLLVSELAEAGLAGVVGSADIYGGGAAARRGLAPGHGARWMGVAGVKGRDSGDT